jgi:hypothetical protein
MMDSYSDDDSQPRDTRGSDFGGSFFSASDDEADVRSCESEEASFASSLCSSPRDGIHNDSDDSSTDPDDASTGGRRSNQRGRNGATIVEIPAQLPPEERADLGDNPAPRPGRSIADHIIHNNEFCLLSFDIEHGGEYCGIVQLSAEFCTMKLKESGPSKDKLEDWGRHTDTFDSYVNPGENAIWDDALTAVHGLRRTDQRIVNAPSIPIPLADHMTTM